MSDVRVHSDFVDIRSKSQNNLRGRYHFTPFTDEKTNVQRSKE